MSEKIEGDAVQKGINEPTKLPDGSYQIDKIIFYPDKPLGVGCMGTTVFKGKFQNRLKSIKYIL